MRSRWRENPAAREGQRRVPAVRMESVAIQRHAHAALPPRHQTPPRTAREGRRPPHGKTPQPAQAEVPANPYGSMISRGPLSCEPIPADIEVIHTVFVVFADCPEDFFPFSPGYRLLPLSGWYRNRRPRAALTVASVQFSFLTFSSAADRKFPSVRSGAVHRFSIST